MSDDNFGPWIDWAGGECPIPDAKAGDFEIRNHEGDEEGSDQPAIWWSSGANDWWKNGRIIAYRVRLPADDLLRQAIEAVRAWQEWEADIIMNGDWSNSMPRLTQSQYDRMIEMQEPRRAVLTAYDKREQS